MSESPLIQGIAAVLDIANLDTDQIMPKQFLRGIDKAGLDKGVLWDLRFDGEGIARPDFVLNQAAFAGTRVLITGPNFGCGSSREHAVWGLQQFGIEAVIASSFGEIFYSNAMNNRLLAVVLPQEDVRALMAEAGKIQGPLSIAIDVEASTVRTAHVTSAITMSAWHRRMVLEGLDMVGASITHQAEIDAFAQHHGAAQPWVKDVASKTAQRLVGHARG